MNLAEIQKTASEAYRAGFGQTWVTFGERHERGIAAVVAAVAQAVQDSVNDLRAGGHSVAYYLAALQDVSNALASLLKPADERVPVLSRWISEGDMPLALAALDALPKGRA